MPRITALRPALGTMLVTMTVAFGGVSTAHEFGLQGNLPSRFERFVVRGGGVRVLQYYDIGHVDGRGGVALFRVGRISAIGQAAALLALEVRVSATTAAPQALQAGFVDADDLGSLMKALEELDRMFKTRAAVVNAEVAEAESFAGTVRIGAVLTNRPGDRDRFLIVAGNPSPATATFDPGDVAKIQALVSKALEKITELGSLKSGER